MSTSSPVRNRPLLDPHRTGDLNSVCRADQEEIYDAEVIGDSLGEKGVASRQVTSERRRLPGASFSPSILAGVGGAVFSCVFGLLASMWLEVDAYRVGQMTWHGLMPVTLAVALGTQLIRSRKRLLGSVALALGLFVAILPVLLAGPFSGLVSGFQVIEGHALTESGDIDSAIVVLTAAIRRNPESAKAYLNRGVAFANKEEFVSAIEDFNEATRLDPQLENAYLSRGAAIGNMGELEQAVADCTKALQLNPNILDAYLVRGNVYVDKGEYEKAISDCT